MLIHAIVYGCIAALAFALTAIISHYLIPVLASRKMGQKILDIGPRWHKSKEGTPTMGGLAFLVVAFVLGIAVSIWLVIKEGAQSAAPFIMTIALALASGLIGIVDDSAKLRKKQNEGLTAAQKFLLQVLCAALYLAGMYFFGGLRDGKLYIPFADITLPLGFAFYIIALFLIVGIMNAVNLTDGIDGLASSVTAVVSVFFGLCAFFAAEKVNAPLSAVSALMLGICVGFLVYNFYPARVFMGDTGSLFLGGLVVGGAFLLSNPLIIVICGFVYIMETASVMLQVGYFKLTHGKRLFKMAPIHHHFEKCGWSEIKIVVIFSLITALLCGLAWLGLK
ncbi:MAG: phospho-N-acetylmuramoyl-pentapeptide-transferase [Ruminococcaceae bacterium]|nr:phospho-N-acetylmuramoyl-pentapeptide-transferase [Oscillospiraceae bacterium]